MRVRRGRLKRRDSLVSSSYSSTQPNLTNEANHPYAHRYAEKVEGKDRRSTRCWFLTLKIWRGRKGWKGWVGCFGFEGIGVEPESKGAIGRKALGTSGSPFSRHHREPARKGNFNIRYQEVSGAAKRAQVRLSQEGISSEISEPSIYGW